jgi:tripartite-type tricarboxylate transporter receptor subunit TctC
MAVWTGFFVAVRATVGAKGNGSSGETMMRLLKAALAAAVLCAATAAQAQDAYPSRPVRIVVPAAPGGSFDALARIVAQALSERWPHRVIVDNRPGGGGNIGAGAVAKADPDGYTLLTWNDSLLINPYLFKEVPFDPKRDFVPISLSMYSPNVLAAHPSSGFKTFDDFLKAARANPGKLSYGSPGTGSPGHLSFEILKRLAGIDVLHVPYRGAGPAIIDMVAGQVPMGMVAIPGAIGHIKNNALVGLAVTSSERVKAMPTVPTIAEAGVPDYKINAFHGFLVPAGTPPAIVAKLDKDINDVLKRPDISQKLVDLGFDPVAGSGKDFAAIIDRDLPVWKDVVEKSGAKAE